MRRLVWLLFWLTPTAHAQAPEDLLRAVREARDRLDYVAAEARAREALAQYGAFSPDELVEVHTALGVVLHARGEEIEARDQFRAALSLDPDLGLDPLLVSPKTLALFDAVRAERAAAPPLSPGAAPVRYVVLRDLRPGAALRSAALPGWGQVYKGERGRGVAYAVGVGAAAAGATGAHLSYRAARRRYRDATTPETIERAYGAAQARYRLRNVLALAAAIGWAASVVDALATGAPEAGEASLRIDPGGVALRVPF